MAQGLLNALCGDKYEAYSAGVEPTRVDPYDIKVMAEAGIDISKHRSKSIEEFRGKKFSYVITVCEESKEVCPFFLGEKILHKGFTDPSEFKGAEDEIIETVRRVRDEIRNWIEKTFCEDS